MSSSVNSTSSSDALSFLAQSSRRSAVAQPRIDSPESSPFATMFEKRSTPPVGSTDKGAELRDRPSSRRDVASRSKRATADDRTDANQSSKSASPTRADLAADRASKQPEGKAGKDSDREPAAVDEKAVDANEQTPENDSEETAASEAAAVDEASQFTAGALVNRPTATQAATSSEQSVSNTASTASQAQASLAGANQSQAAATQLSSQPSSEPASQTPGIAIVDSAASKADPGMGSNTGGESGSQSNGQAKAKAVPLSVAGANDNAASQPTQSSTAPSPGVAADSPAASRSASSPTSSARIAQPSVNLASTAGAATPANDDPNVARVSRGLSSAIAQRGGAVTLRLTPVDMGTVRIQMQMTGTTLSASFHAESASAHMLLSQQLGSLRQSLEGQGLQVERLSVQAMQAAPSQNAQSGSNSGNSQQDATGQQQSANDGRSRGQYSRQGNGGQGEQQNDARTSQAPRNFQEHFDQIDAADAA